MMVLDAKKKSPFAQNIIQQIIVLFHNKANVILMVPIALVLQSVHQ